jgi:hypothetical protein
MRVYDSETESKGLINATNYGSFAVEIDGVNSGPRKFFNERLYFVIFKLACKADDVVFYFSNEQLSAVGFTKFRNGRKEL